MKQVFNAQHETAKNDIIVEEINRFFICRTFTFLDLVFFFKFGCGLCRCGGRGGARGILIFLWNFENLVKFVRPWAIFAGLQRNFSTFSPVELNYLSVSTSYHVKFASQTSRNIPTISRSKKSLNETTTLSSSRLYIFLLLRNFSFSLFFIDFKIPNDK